MTAQHLDSCVVPDGDDYSFEIPRCAPGCLATLPERLAKALDYEPDELFGAGHHYWWKSDREGFCLECDGFPAIGWAIVPEIVAAIEAEGWRVKWEQDSNGHWYAWTMERRLTSLHDGFGSAPDAPTALAEAFCKAKEAQS